MHDANRTPLQVGDKVLIPAVITELSEGTEEYCNVCVETTIGRRPDDKKERLCSINTGVLVKFVAIAMMFILPAMTFGATVDCRPYADPLGICDGCTQTTTLDATTTDADTRLDETSATPTTACQGKPVRKLLRFVASRPLRRLVAHRPHLLRRLVHRRQ